MPLPKGAKERKDIPIMRGVLDYFPDAIAEVANVSLVGGEQHHPGQPIHWEKGKSTDEADSCVRHLMERGKRDSDGLRHSAKAAWRALANLQREIEAEGAADFDMSEMHEVKAKKDEAMKKFWENCQSETCQEAVPPHWDRLLECTSEKCHRPLPCPVHDKERGSYQNGCCC